MQIVKTRASLQRLKTKPKIFVPTMGALHAGHLNLIKEARIKAIQNNALLVASIFVNPKQMDDHAEYKNYPRDLSNDLALLAEHQVDIAFTPEVNEIFSEGSFEVNTREMFQDLEGAHRPNHFDGVATILTILFNIVNPIVAVFGKKDYQQLLLAKELVRQFSFSIEIVAAQTARDENGLAHSSRNLKLSQDQRLKASYIYKQLKFLKEQIQAGAKDYVNLEQIVVNRLESEGFKADYVAIRDKDSLTFSPNSQNLILLIAAWLDGVRLIDNLEI